MVLSTPKRDFSGSTPDGLVAENGAEMELLEECCCAIGREDEAFPFREGKQAGGGLTMVSFGLMGQTCEMCDSARTRLLDYD